MHVDAHKSTLLNSIPMKLNLLHNLTFFFLKNCFHIVIPFYPRLHLSGSCNHGNAIILTEGVSVGTCLHRGNLTVPCLWQVTDVLLEEKRIPKRVLEWKPIGRRNRGRPRKRWIEDIEEDIQVMGIRGWRILCKERAEWKKITEKAKTHSGL
jgi:hypothetical protein